MMHKRTPARALGPAKLDRPRLERVYPRVRLFSALDEVIRVAAQEAPRGVTIFVASRADPPVAFTRMEASDALARIGWEDIRLSEEETMGIVQLKRDKEPLPTDVIQ